MQFINFRKPKQVGPIQTAFVEENRSLRLNRSRTFEQFTVR